MTDDDREELLACGLTAAEGIKTAWDKSEPGDTIIIHEADCEAEKVDDECTCQPIVLERTELFCQGWGKA